MPSDTIKAPDRESIQRLVASANAQEASMALCERWHADSSNATAAFVVKQFECLRGRIPLTPYRLTILRSFTVEPLIPLLRAAAFCVGLDLHVQISEFNAYVQDLIEPTSPLYSFSPDAVILAVQTRDLAPQLWDKFATLSEHEIETVVAATLACFRNWFQVFREYSSAHLVVHNLEVPAQPSRGILDAQWTVNQTQAIHHINREIAAAASQLPGIFVLDYDGLLARNGRGNWHDERKWLSVRLPFAVASLFPMVSEWIKFLVPLSGKSRKVLAVDLDNTLWGGIVGEDGIDGIRLGGDYPGAAFQEFQRALLDLYHRGILLTICSKNNPDDAMEVIEKHEGMILKPSHFAAVRINWSDKWQNLKEIAAELNLGLDALAFLDDNPVERQMVRRSLPEVLVLDLPQDPMLFAQVVRECPQFERLKLSQEDLQRSTLYQHQREREGLARSVASREEFYRSLQQELEIAPVTAATLPRVAQLTNKTNQFNLTTRRYTEQEIARLQETDGWNCFSLKVRDRFGDNGLVGVAITHLLDGAYQIDTLLLSCRVIGRTVETAFLSFLVDYGRSQGASRMEGWFFPTKKNTPAREFYALHGFTPTRQEDNGTLWTLDLSTARVPCPEWCKLAVSNGERQS